VARGRVAVLVSGSPGLNRQTWTCPPASDAAANPSTTTSLGGTGAATRTFSEGRQIDEGTRVLISI